MLSEGERDMNPKCDWCGKIQKKGNTSTVTIKGDSIITEQVNTQYFCKCGCNSIYFNVTERKV